MTGLSEPQDVIVVEVDGLTIEGPGRSRSYVHALGRGLAEPFMVQLFRQVVRPGASVLDIGAFLGQYSLLAAQLVGPTGRVYSFEPDPRNYPFLVRNLERNGLGDRVVAVPSAVADRAGTQDLFIDPNVGSGSSLAFRRRRRVAAMPVTCVAIDEFLDESAVADVIKLDVEGGEVRALRGMERTIRRGSPKLVLFVECFPEGLRAAGTSAPELIRQLEALGFTVLVIDERRRRLLPLSSRSSLLWYLKFLLYLGLNSLVLANLLCVRNANHPALANHLEL